MTLLNFSTSFQQAKLIYELCSLYGHGDKLAFSITKMSEKQLDSIKLSTVVSNRPMDILS